MNLGDGLKLETEILDGKTKLILSPYDHKSKISVKMGSKSRIAKRPLRMKQTGHILKSTQNSCVESEKLLQKTTVGSETSQAKGKKNGMTFSSTKDLCKQYISKDCLHIQREIAPATFHIQKTRNTVSTSLGAKQKPHKKHITAGNTKSSLVCLTQDQLQQILMTINQGNRSISLTDNGTKEEKSQYSLHLNNIPNQPKDENNMGLLQKTEAVSSVPDENKSVLKKNQETSKCEQKIAIENEWKPADIFSTLGEREYDRSLLEAKKAQWRKELDEQVALKKKEKEASEKWNDPWKKSESDKITWEKLQILDQCRETVLLKHPFSTVKQEQQRKWIEELNKQIEDDRQRKIEEKIIYSKGEEHDRWAMHFDSLKDYPGSQSQLSSRSTHKQPEYFCVSPDTQELADTSSVFTPTTGSQVEPSEEEHIAKPVRDVVMANNQRTNFLRSMTALLDPAQIEERDRRRQKQLEHQKAITAQVEEKRRKKQQEEEQRKKEEQEEERRLAREREEMQKQYEEDILKQKQKEEIMTLKTNEIFQTMQQAQELAQRLKQEQRIRELAQKGHDTSRLIKNLGVDTIQVEYNASTNNISNSRHESDEVSGELNTCINSAVSPKKDTGVQTDDLNTGIFTNAESHYGSLTGREIIHCSSPGISAEFNGEFSSKKNKQELSQDKGANLEKENSWYNDLCNPEKQTKHMKKCHQRPDWNINKPLKRYIPASEKYPKQLQKQREEKKVRRQMELLHLVERNNPGHLSQHRGMSPDFHSSHQETESKFRWHLVKKEEEPLKINSCSKERSQSSPVPAVKNRTQQTQTNTLHLPLKNSSFERENPILGGSHMELSPGISEPPHFVPYVRTNEIYYLDPDAPLSRPSTQDPQYQNSQDCDQEQQQLFDCEHVRDPLLNPNLVRNRDRQQAILKGLSELRQGLLQKQKELETNFMPLAANQEENFSSSL
ncbi:PREDICTED: coiled-coil domain-containing protein 66 [Propithecus coquereli]|uniref:Coiled-coil domain containing 66 n=1 Tax=Propithecus coquereli TaxID=379532 RepID=A0A2K6FT46_PROCO|nr:PREDICTED: coiled-coil domain-containing protein 66 [Propithecus coquereli]